MISMGEIPRERPLGDKKWAIFDISDPTQINPSLNCLCEHNHSPRFGGQRTPWATVINEIESRAVYFVDKAC